VQGWTGREVNQSRAGCGTDHYAENTEERAQNNSCEKDMMSLGEHAQYPQTLYDPYLEFLRDKDTKWNHYFQSHGLRSASVEVHSYHLPRDSMPEWRF